MTEKNVDSVVDKIVADARVEIESRASQACDLIRSQAEKSNFAIETAARIAGRSGDLVGLLQHDAVAVGRVEAYAGDTLWFDLRVASRCVDLKMLFGDKVLAPGEYVVVVSLKRRGP